MFVVSAKPGESGLADLSLLEGGHRKLRDAVREGSAALDLYKDNCIAIHCHNIDFTTLAAEVALDQLKTVSHQESRRQFFAATADPGILKSSAISPSHGST